MELTPKLPPGRANRKALAFTAEIRRLRGAGYTYEAIRLALLDVGVEVSRTTVKREARRRGCRVSMLPPAPTPASMPLLSSLAPLPDSARVRSSPDGVTAYVGDGRSGKAIAEAFMEGRITNPLIRQRMNDEARRD